MRRRRRTVLDNGTADGDDDGAERAVTDGLRRTGKHDLQAALVAVDPQTGNILALVGGRDYALSAFNRASRSRRQRTRVSH